MAKKQRRPLKQRFVEGWPASYIYVEDRMAGLRNVYTVWRIPMTGVDRLAHVIGRELPITIVHQVIKRDQKSLATMAGQARQKLKLAALEYANALTESSQHP